MIAIAHTTDLRACCAVGTVKNRIRMCGRPAVPKTSAMPSEIWSIGALKYSPGSRKRWPSSAAVIVLAGSPISVATLACTFGSATTSCRNPGSEKPYGDHTRITSTSDAITSRMALMICTQVVATMPPNST